MHLTDLCQNLIPLPADAGAMPVHGLAIDSRKVGVGDVFFAVAGSHSDGRDYIADAVKAIDAPVVEVHISNIYEREEFRHFSYLKAVYPYHVVGKGLDGYREAIEYIQAL